MSPNVLGWIKIIGAGAGAAAAVIAAPLTAGASLGVGVYIIAGLAALTTAGTTASALHQEPPPKAGK